MAIQDRIDIDIFKVVTHAIAASDSLENMTDQLTQLLVGALQIKGCALFALNPDTDELEALSSFGLSVNYMNKGPLLLNKSFGPKLRSEPVVISDISASDQLQYPNEARQEGIVAIVSVPITLYGKFIGVLRLYHLKAWEVSERDIDSLATLTEIIGFAMMYTRLLQSMRAIKATVNDIHSVWLSARSD